MTPTSRTLQHYKKLGLPVCVTEKWNPWAGKKQDLFGFIDLVVLAPKHIIGVQTTSGAHHAERIAKILASPYALYWLNSGGHIVVMSWYKKANGRYSMREEEVTIESFHGTLKV